MKIKQKTGQTKESFFIEQDGKIITEMTYSWAGTDKIVIDHTEVDKSLKGQDTEIKLLTKAVEFARANGSKIIPLWLFARLGHAIVPLNLSVFK